MLNLAPTMVMDSGFSTIAAIANNIMCSGASLSARTPVSLLGAVKNVVKHTPDKNDRRQYPNPFCREGARIAVAQHAEYESGKHRKKVGFSSCAKNWLLCNVIGPIAARVIFCGSGSLTIEARNEAKRSSVELRSLVEDFAFPTQARLQSVQVTNSVRPMTHPAT
jgi:hypothetical protein